MAKAKLVIEMNYQKYVLDGADALTILEILGRAEMYQYKYTDNHERVHYVWPADQTELSLMYLPENLYRIAKLAGKPGNSE